MDLRDVAFVVLFVTVPLLTTFMLWLAGISPRRFSIPSLFIWWYLFFCYFGILPLYFGWDEYSISLLVDDRAIVFRMLAYSSAALLLVSLGFVYGCGVIGLGTGEVRSRPLTPSTRAQRVAAWLLVAVCVGVFLDYLSQLNSIAVLKALAGDTAGAAIARSEMGNAFAGKYWRYRLFFRVLLDYSVIFFLADWMIRRRFSGFIWFAAAAGAAVVTAIVAIEKGPVINLVLAMYLAYVMYKGGRYWQPAAKYLAIAVPALVAVLYIAFMGTPDMGSALKYMSDRILIGQIRPAYYYLHIFPRYMDFLGGRSLPNPGGLLPFEPFALTQEVERFMWPANAASGIVGTAPTVFWGEMYANFGTLGVLACAFFVGLGLIVIASVLGRHPLSPPIIAATCTLAIHYMGLTATSLSNYFVDTTLAGIAAVTALSLVLGRTRGRPRSAAPANLTGAVAPGAAR